MCDILSNKANHNTGNDPSVLSEQVHTALFPAESGKLPLYSPVLPLKIEPASLGFNFVLDG